MANPSIEQYIDGLNYDPRVILSVVPDGTTSSLPVKDRQGTSNGVIICTKIQHKLNKNLDAVAILSPTAGVVYPGALVRADEDLSDGHPTPIALPRGPVTLSVDLPGLANPSETLLPSNSSVQKFINAKLEEWNKQAGSQGYINAARSFLQTTQAYSSQQVALDLGFNSKWASGNASAQINTSSSTEKSVVVAYYQQVFYTITMDTPATPASVFDDAVGLEQAKRAFSEPHPPAYVRSIDYGRLLMVKMETSSVDTSVNLKAAFEQATQGGVSVGGNTNAKYQDIIRNASFTALAIGGGAQTPVQIFSGGSDAGLAGLKDYIAKDAGYRRDNPGLPVAYTVAFLKDNEFARMGFTTDYTETECVRYPNAFVKFAHSGAYVAKFQVTWAEADAQGNYTRSMDWESGNQTVGYTHQVDLPGDAQGVRLHAWAATGLIWDPWGEILNIALDGPDNKCYRVTGTTLNRSWDNNC
ncbi:MAG TPA: thiol-activated cytolysin family protein [Stellaceae bacterium]|nr:thiol-activated cytolysin family protein [Stellaceae bacterium]